MLQAIVLDIIFQRLQ